MLWTADAAAALAVGRLRVPGIPAWLRRKGVTSALPFGLRHQVAVLLITTTALPFPVFCQHMMIVKQSRCVSFVFGWTDWKKPLVNLIDLVLELVSCQSMAAVCKLT